MRTPRVYSAEVNGVFTQIKAYNKNHAIEGFKELSGGSGVKDVTYLGLRNSQQTVWDEK